MILSVRAPAERVAIERGLSGRWRTPWGPLVLIGAAALVGGCRRSRPQLTRGDAAVVVGESPTAPGASAPQVERESTPDSPEAMVVAFGPSGEFVLKGSLGAGDNEDRFEIGVPGTPVAPESADAAAAPAAPSLQLALALSPASALATSLTVVNDFAVSVARSAGAPGLEHGTPNLAVAPGQRLFVVVRRSGKPPVGDASLAYALTGQLSALGAADEREPNGTAAQATVTGWAHTGPELAGYLGARDDVDWYRVPIGEAADGTVLAIKLEPPAEVAASVAVHDQAGTRLQVARSSKGRPVILRQLGPKILAAGGAAGEPPAFFVEVRSEGGEDRAHRYLLRVWSEESSTGEREPNDDVPHAFPLPDGETFGFLSGADVDFYRFEGQAGQAVVVTLSPPAGIDGVLEAMLPGQARWTRVDAQRRGQPETLPLTPPAGGPIFLKVSAKRDPGAGDEPYRILLERR